MRLLQWAGMEQVKKTEHVLFPKKFLILPPFFPLPVAGEFGTRLKKLKLNNWTKKTEQNNNKVFTKNLFHSIVNDLAYCVSKCVQNIRMGHSRPVFILANVETSPALIKNSMASLWLVLSMTYGILTEVEASVQLTSSLS